jgi:hypothetical protein
MEEFSINEAENQTEFHGAVERNRIQALIQRHCLIPVFTIFITPTIIPTTVSRKVLGLVTTHSRRSGLQKAVIHYPLFSKRITTSNPYISPATRLAPA